MEGPSDTGIPVLMKSNSYNLKSFSATLIPINITKQIPANPEMAQYVEEKIHNYNQESLKTIGFTDVDLETRFSKIRVHEANISNFFADLIRAEFNTDIAVFNTGTIRADEYYYPGPLTY